jgi:DNA adenine methylase
MKPTRPALRYFGGKWRLAPWIISHFPQHDCYVEPFCGAASVFLRKSPAQFEVINDIDGDVINFFCVLREQTENLIRIILTTPYSRDEHRIAWEPLTGLDPLEQARRYYVRSWQGWGGGQSLRQSGWRYQHSNNRGKSVIKDWNEIEHLWAIAWRLKQAFIENDDALKIIERYDQPHTLFYLDPPYLAHTRTDRWKETAYQHEIDVDYHRALLDKLQAIRGMAIISGYPSTLYEEQLSGWQKLETTARTTNTSKAATETIWLSSAATKRGQGLLWPLDDNHTEGERDERR